MEDMCREGDWMEDLCRKAIIEKRPSFKDSSSFARYVGYSDAVSIVPRPWCISLSCAISV